MTNRTCLGCNIELTGDVITLAAWEIHIKNRFNGTESGTEFPGRCLYAQCEAGRLDFPFDKDEGQNAPERKHDGKE
jgi:hypothetical protein